MVNPDNSENEAIHLVQATAGAGQPARSCPLSYRESHDHVPPDPSGALWTVPVPFNVVSGRR